ncbi:acyl carrier protein [Siccirubricoccus deserti]
MVHQTLTEVLQLDPGEIGGDSLMAEIGLDSIGMVDVQARLEAALGSVPREALMGAQTVRDLVAGLAALAAAAPTPAETGAGAAPAIGLRAVQADGAGAPALGAELHRRDRLGPSARHGLCRAAPHLAAGAGWLACGGRDPGRDRGGHGEGGA